MAKIIPVNWHPPHLRMEGVIDEPGIAHSRKDRRAAAMLLKEEQAKYLVSSYYKVQEFRTASSNVAFALSSNELPCQFISWLSDSQKRIEEHIKIALDDYVKTDPTGAWIMSLHGFGPVLAAGLLSHIDIHKAPTVGHVWSFAGLNPKVTWERGKKRPWNAELKSLCCHPDTLITTRKGPIAIKDVAVGDMVLTHAGNWQKVRVKYENDFDGDLIGLRGKQTTHQIVWLTPGHPVYSKDLSQGGDDDTVSFAWRPVENVKENDMLLSVFISRRTGGSIESNERVAGESTSWPHSGKVYNLEVENDESYIANGYAVHNCWKISDCIVKFSGSPKSYYGPIYRHRKALEEDRNALGEFADQAKAKLENFNIRDKATRAIYEAGKLPPGRLDLRARRVAVKLFLSHLHDVMTWHTFDRRAPRPYALEHMGHAHMIECPNPPWK